MAHIIGIDRASGESYTRGVATKVCDECRGTKQDANDSTKPCRSCQGNGLKRAQDFGLVQKGSE